MAETKVLPPSSKPATVTPSTGVRAKVKRGNQKFENIELGELVTEGCEKVDDGRQALQVLEGCRGRESHRRVLNLEASSQTGSPISMFHRFSPLFIKNSLTRMSRNNVRKGIIHKPKFKFSVTGHKISTALYYGQ